MTAQSTPLLIERCDTRWTGGEKKSQNGINMKPDGIADGCLSSR